MTSFEVFNTFNLLLGGAAFIFTGIFIFRKFKDDLEEKSLGALLFLVGIPFLTMGIRVFLSIFKIIDEKTSYHVYFAQQIILTFIFIPAGFHIFYRAFNLKMAKIGGILGILIALISLTILFSGTEKEIGLYSLTWGPMYMFPFFMKVLLFGGAGFFLLVMIYDLISRFYYWFKTRNISYKFFTQLIFILFGVSGMTLFLAREGLPWKVALLYILAIGFALTFYLIYSQEAAKREEKKG